MLFSYEMKLPYKAQFKGSVRREKEESTLEQSRRPRSTQPRYQIRMP